MIPPSAGWMEGRTHVLPVRIYYEDTDFTGVVYHANYLRYFERGRSDCLRLAGVGHSALLDQDQPGAFTVARMEVAFRRPARIDDALHVRTLYDRVKGPRLFIRQTLVRGEELLTEAQVEAAYIDLDGRPRKPPKALLSAIAPLISPGT